MASCAGALVLILSEAGFHLRQLGLALLHGTPRRFHRGAVGVHGGVLGFGGGGNLIELLLRHFFVLDEQCVASQVGLALAALACASARRAAADSRSRSATPMAASALATSASAPVILVLLSFCVIGTLGLLRGHLAAGLRDLSAGLIDGDLEVARIEIHQRIARFHDLVVIDIDVRDGAVDARADGAQVSFHLGVVGGFELARLEPKVDTDSGGDQKHQEEDDEGASAPTSDGRRLRPLVGAGGRRRGCVWTGGSGAHGRTPLNKVGRSVSACPMARDKEMRAKSKANSPEM